MPMRYEVNGEVLTAYLSGELDHHAARPIREELDAAIERGRPSLLVLDFRDITFMDSSGIGLIMGRYQQMRQIGGEIHVESASPQICKVMRLAGLDRLAEIGKPKK